MVISWKKQYIVYLFIWLIIYPSIIYGQQENSNSSDNEDVYDGIGDDDDSNSNSNKSDDSIPFDRASLPKATSAPPGTSDAPFQLTILDPKNLQENKLHMHDFDKGLQRALWFLQKSAIKRLENNKKFTVFNNEKTDCDANDYVSLARYFWPDSNTANGLPYVRYDGHVNPEIKKLPDYETFHDMVKELEFLSLAYYFFDNETYAEKGYQHINNFFIDPQTRMNPHLHYASYIRGYDKGRSKGIIDFSHLPFVLDSIVLLQTSKAWKKGTNSELRHWFTTYLNWMTTSAHGIEESESKNNHGTYYDVQKIALYLFLNQTEKAQQASQEAMQKRISEQIRPSGEQLLETARPFSWYYSTFNLKGFFILGRLGQKVNIDLFHYQTDQHASIKKALDYLIPSAMNEASWKFNNTGGFKSGSRYLISILEEAYDVYQDKKYLIVRDDLSEEYGSQFNITRLTSNWARFGDHSDSAQRGFADALDNHAATTSISLCIFFIFISSLFTLFFSFNIV
ncbi:unnamed protein product [Cunninghamella blakesleeana]